MVQFTVEELNGSNCKTYLLQYSGLAIIVDPLRERVQEYLRMVAARQLQLQFVVETHTHADHWMLDRAAKAAMGVPWLMHVASPIPLVDRHLHDGDRLQLGDLEIAVWHTPGHTPDSISLVLPGVVFTGDTLLIGGSGRTDFPGGDAGAQFDAVTGRLFALPEHTIVYPAHDYKGRSHSTIAAEKRDNPRFSGKTREQYIELMSGLNLPLPDHIQECLQVNQSGLDSREIGFPGMAELAQVSSIDVYSMAEQLASSHPPTVLDVREPEEFTGELGHIAGALLVPLDALAGRLPKLAGLSERDVVVVCRAGARSATAAAILTRAGFRAARNLAGGMLAWTAAGLPVQH